MGYDFTIEYKQGKYNLVADGLSRKGETARLCALTLPSPTWWASVVELNGTSTEIMNLKKGVEEGRLSNPWSIKKEVLFYKDQVYIPEDSNFVPIILQQYHDLGHEGFYKTVQRIKECFHWKT